MRLPLELIVVILLAKLLFDPTASGKPLSSLPDLGQHQVLLSFVFLGAMTGLLYLLALGGAAVSKYRLRSNPQDRPRIFEAHGRLLVAERALLVVAFMVFASSTGWSNVVYNYRGMNLSGTVICDDLWIILPFLLGSVALWLGNYPASKALSPADWGVFGYLRGQARGLFFLLGPWMIMNSLLDSYEYWPKAITEFCESNPWVGLLGYVLVFAALLLLFPFYVIRLWPHEKMPAGPVRERLELLLKRAGVRCRELMVWNTGRGRWSNAAVMGPVAWSRYIAFTDALLDDLNEGEIEAVLGHELGHVRYHHIAYYMVFFLVFMLGFTVVGLFLPPFFSPDTTAGRWSTGIIVAAMLVFFWRFVFGFLSRRFEREADVAACELVGSPLPLMTALEKLALASGGSRTANNWRHFSVAARVAYLSRFGFDAEALREYHSSVKTIKGAALVLVLVLGGVLLLKSGESFIRAHTQVLKEMQLERAVSVSEHDYEKWTELGKLKRKLRKYDEAWAAFGKVIELKPADPDGYLLRAELCLRAQDWDGHDPAKAVQLCETAVRVSLKKIRAGEPAKRNRREVAWSLASLAEAHFSDARRELAREKILEALKWLPDSPDLKKLLEKYNKALSRQKERTEEETRQGEDETPTS